MDRDEAREKAAELKDRAGEVLDDLRARGQEFLGKHEDKIDTAIDRVAGFVDDQTKGKYHDKIETVAGKAKDTVERLAVDPTTGQTTEAPADTPVADTVVTDTVVTDVPAAGPTTSDAGAPGPDAAASTAAFGGTGAPADAPAETVVPDDAAPASSAGSSEPGAASESAATSQTEPSDDEPTGTPPSQAESARRTTQAEG